MRNCYKSQAEIGNAIIKYIRDMISQKAGLRFFGMLRRFAFASSKFVEEASSAEDFKKKMASAKGPVLVDFYSPKCNVCKALAPRLDKKAE